MASRPEMREDDESGFCKFFRNLPQKNDDTIRIFDRGDYYSAHGEDAKFIANSVSADSFHVNIPVLTAAAGLPDDSCFTQVGTRARPRICHHDHDGLSQLPPRRPFPFE